MRKERRDQMVHLQNCVSVPSPPEAVGKNPGFALQFARESGQTFTLSETHEFHLRTTS